MAPIHAPTAGHDLFAEAASPAAVKGRRANGPRFGDPRVHTLLSAFVVFRLVPTPFTNRDMPADPGQVSHNLRRPRLHGRIEPTPHTNRYDVTDTALRTALSSSTTRLPDSYDLPVTTRHVQT
jgi:hypothetical protein